METIRVYEREESMNSQHNHAMTATISQHEVYAEASHWRSPFIHFLKPPYPIIMDPSKVRFMPLQAHSGERLLLLDRVNTCKLNLPQSKPFSLNIHGQKIQISFLTIHSQTYLYKTSHFLKKIAVKIVPSTERMLLRNWISLFVYL